MAFILRVFDETDTIPITDIYISAGSISKKLDSSSELSLSLPSNTAAAADLDEGQIVELYLNGDLLLKGEIQKLSLGVLSVGKAISISGRDSLDTLYDVAPDPTLILSGKEFLLALYELLEPCAWRLGDISTVTDKEFIIETIDLRNEHSYLDQVRKVLELQEGLSLVVGDQVLGENTISIGTLDGNSGALFRSPGDRFYTELPQNFNIITKLTEKKSNEEEIFYLEAVGGEVKDSFGIHRSINLYDAWDNDNSLATDPDFPIVEIVPGQRYAVLNAEKNPQPGGLFYTVNAAAQTSIKFMGDSGSAGRMLWSGYSFRGIPGRLNYISFVLNSIVGDFYGDWLGEPITIWLSILGTPDSYTHDHFNAQRLFEGPFVEADGLAPFGEYRLDLTNTGLLSDLDTIYGFAIGFDNAQVVNSYITAIGYSGVSGTDVGMGHCQTSLTNGDNEVWLNSNLFSSMKVFTEPVGNRFRRNQQFQKWAEYAPPKDGENNSTLAQTRAGGQALYARAIAHLKQHSSVRRNYSMSAIGRNLIVPLGEKISVLGKAQTAIQNPVTGKITADYHEVNDDYRVLGYKVEVKSNKVSATYELSDISLFEEQGIPDLYDRTKFHPQIEGTVYPFSLQPEMVKEQVSLSNMLPDTTIEDGRDALLVEFPYNRPIDRHFSDFIGLPFVDSPTEEITIEIVSGTDDSNEVSLICKVVTGTGWTVNSSILLESYFIWR